MMGISMCDLASRLPYVIGALLDRESKLKRGRFREETLTDIFSGALAAFAGPELVIQYPHEPTTGGDIDLEFWHVETNRNIFLRLQAKRLSAAQERGKSVGIASRSYRELLHKVPKTGVYQFQTLTNTSGSSLPMYIFYNHTSVALDPYFFGQLPTVSGVNLAFAQDIADELNMIITAKPSVLRYKRLSHLRRHFFGLNAILCPGKESKDTVPTPDSVSTELINQWQRIRGSFDASSVDERILRYLFRPDEILTRGALRRRLSDGPAVRVTRDVERPTVTFISGRTGDERTPRIFINNPRHPDYQR
jgi:hypothetical protein